MFGNPNKYWPPLAEASDYNKNALLIFLMSSTPLKDVLSNAKDSFENRTKLVNYLLRIHEDRGGGDRGRRDESFLPLNMSAMVLITACWESYLETLLSETFEFLLDSSDSHEKISSTLKRKISDETNRNSDHRRVCNLTGNSWKDISRENFREKLGRFGSPSGKKVDKLFKQILDLENLSKSWFWKKMSYGNAVEKLDKFLLVRNKIAHGETVKVKKNNFESYLKHVKKLIDKTEKKVKSHIEELLENQEVSE